MASPAKRMKYDASFKLQAVAFAMSSNNCAAAREFGISEKLVRYWKKSEASLKNIPQNKCATRAGVCYWPQLENYLEGWVKENRENGYRVTRNRICSQALKWAKTHPGESKDFKGTVNWCARFMKRKKLQMRRRAKVKKTLPVDSWRLEAQSSSQNSASAATQDHSHMEMYPALDLRLVKRESSDSLCDDTSGKLSNIVEMAGWGIFQQNTGSSNTEPSMAGDVSEASFDVGSCSKLSENMSSVAETSDDPSWTNDSLQLPDEETVVTRAQVSGMSLDVTVDSTSNDHQRLQTPYANDEFDLILNAHLKTDKLEEPCRHQGFTENCYMTLCSGEQIFKCDDCGASFFQIGDLMYHIKLHSIEKPFKCDICGALFTHPDSLKCHRSTHTGEKPFRCDICGASFAVNSYLKSHMRTHASEKHFKCDCCDASFAQCTSLKLHKRIHTGEKPYSCDVCGAYFARAGNLRYHMRIHTGEKPYQCNICSASFTLSNHLKSHVRTHTGEKPYKCDVCGASFAQCTSLKTHMRTHTGEKPYKCDLCGACFARADILKCHKKTHSCEIPSNCHF